MTEKVQAPMILDPAFIERLRIRDSATGKIIDDSALDALAAGMHSALAVAEQLAAVAQAISKDDTLPPALKAVKLRGLALQLGEKGAAALDRAKAAASAEIEEIEAATAAPDEPTSEIGLHVENQVRQRLADLDDDGRKAIIGEALAGDDELTIGAVLRAPAWLSGMGKEQLAMTRDTWARKKFPAELDRLTRLRKAAEATERGARSFVAFIEKLANAPRAVEAERAAGHAADAIAAAQGGAQ